tara:strand:+ start:214029 stop:214250 length:222 start_codon:yes stop_codon:yes gene_type:complete
MSDIQIELIKGVEGDSLSLVQGEGCGFRIAGPKPWGGGRILQTFTISASDERSLDALQEAIDKARGKKARGKK